MTSAPSERTEVRRLPARGAYDAATVRAILDAGFVCHVAFIVDDTPVVIPTSYARVDDAVYLHGSPASAMLRTAKSGIDISLAVTLVDGLVLARSAFHHSVNYRSVVVFGTAEVVDDLEEKARALDAFVDHVIPGRAADSRPGNDTELKGTLILRLDLAEASAKVRAGDPVDDDEDLDLPHWAGVIPIETHYGVPRDATDLATGIEPPAYVRDYTGPA